MQNAIDAKTKSLAQQRAEISEALIAEAKRALMDMNAAEWQAFNFGGKDNTFEMVKLKFVPVKDRQALMTILGIALDKHKMLDQYDSEQAHNNAVDGWLKAMTENVKSGD